MNILVITYSFRYKRGHFPNGAPLFHLPTLTLKGYERGSTRSKFPPKSPLKAPSPSLRHLFTSHQMYYPLFSSKFYLSASCLIKFNVYSSDCNSSAWREQPLAGCRQLRRAIFIIDNLNGREKCQTRVVGNVNI